MILEVLVQIGVLLALSLIADGSSLGLGGIEVGLLCRF
jgi:hypothetical protein